MADHPFKPGLAAALSKLDPEDSEQIMEYFKTHVLLMREKALLQASVRDEKKLLVENAKLKNDINQLKVQLEEKQRRRTAKALYTPAPPPPRPAPSLGSDPPSSSSSAPPGGAAAATAPPSSSSSSPDKTGRQSRRKRGERNAHPRSDSLPLGAEPRVDISRLDIRIGRILSARRHPLAEALSIQEVDVGEPAPRTVISKLGGKVDMEELRGGLVVLLCNVKPCKLRGVVSQARLFCCSTSNDHIEVLAPPTGSAPGDRVTVHNYPGDPDRQLCVQVWDLVQAELQVDGRGVATYRGGGLEVRGKGLCRANPNPALTSCTLT